MERRMVYGPDAIGMAVVAGAAVRQVLIDDMAELGRDDPLRANRRKGLTQQFFVRKRSVVFRRVEEGDAAVDRGADQRDHFLRLAGRPVIAAHAHAAKSERRYLKTGLAEFALLHFFSFKPKRMRISGRCSAIFVCDCALTAKRVGRMRAERRDAPKKAVSPTSGRQVLDAAEARGELR